MDSWYETLAKWVSNGFTRHYVTQQLHPHLSKKTELVLISLNTLQLLTLLLPLHATSGDTWAYSILWPCWYAVNIVSRPDRVLQVSLGSFRIIEYIYAAIIGLRIVAWTGSMLRYGLMKKDEYWDLLLGEKETGLVRWLVRLDRCTMLIVSRIAAVPILNALMETVLCGVSCSSSFIIATASFPFALLMILTDRYFSVDISWLGHSIGPITPHFALWNATIDSFTALLIPVCNLGGHTFLVRLTVLLFGLGKITFIYTNLPYHYLYINAVESFQGLGLIWQVSLLVLADSISEPTIAPGLLLLLVSPLLFFTNYSLISLRFRYFLLSKNQSDEKYVKILQRNGTQVANSLQSESDNLLQSPILSSHDFANHQIYPIIWTVYYFLQVEDRYFAKKTAGILCEQNTSSRGHAANIQKQVCIARLQVFMRTDPEDKVLQCFLLLEDMEREVEKHDYATSAIIYDFYKALERKNVAFGSLVELSRKLSKEKQATLALYDHIIEVFPKKASLYLAYASYLEMLGKEQSALKYYHLALKLADKKRKRVISGIDRLIQDDPAVVLVVVPLTGRSKGIIEWAVNAEALGYTEETLKGQHCSILLPQIVQNKHTEMLNKLFLKKSMPTIMTNNSTINIYMRSRERELFGGSWRIFCTNDRETGCLMAVVSLRIEPSTKDFAILGPEGELMERTPGFTSFVRETSFLSECNLLSEGGVWKGLWHETTVIITRDTLKLSDRFELPCLTLFKSRSRQGSGMKTGKLRTPSVLETRTLFLSHVSRASNPATDKLYLSPDDSQMTVRNKRNVVHVKGTKRELQKLCRYIALVLVLTFICGSAVSIAVQQSFALSVLQLNENISYITSIGMRVLSIRAAIRSKELYLLNAKYPLYGNETAARADLSAVAASFVTMRAYLYGNSSFVTGKFRKLLLEPLTTLWRYEDDHFTKYEMSQLDLMDELARRIGNLANCSLSQVTRNNSDFMTLYRNGAGEALAAFNASVDLYGQSKSVEADEVLESMKLAAFFGPCICLIVCLSLLFFLFLSLERKRKRIWEVLLSIPKNLVAKYREKVANRVDSLRCEDSEVLRTQDCAYKKSASMKLLLWVMVLLNTFVCLSGLFLYLYGAANMHDILIYKPGYIDWLGMRRANVARSWFQMRESWLPSNLSYSSIVTDTQPFYSQFAIWKQSNDLLLKLHRCFTLGCAEHNMHYLYPSDIHKDMLMGDGLGLTPAATAAGLTPFLNEFTQLSAAARADIATGNITSYKKGKTLEKYVSLAFPALTKSMNQFDLDTKEELEKAKEELETLSILAVTIAFLGLVLLELPLLYKVSAMQVMKSDLREADSVLTSYSD